MEVGCLQALRENFSALARRSKTGPEEKKKKLAEN
jgi:hypothetical protein